MARLFDDAATERIEVNSAPITAVPFSMGCWFRSNDATPNQALVFIGNSGVTNNYWMLRYRGATGAVQLLRDDGSGVDTIATSTTVTTGVWAHACATFTAVNNVAVYLNGGGKNTSAVSRTPTGINRISIGRFGNSTPGNYMSGDIQEVFVYSSIALSDEGVTGLAKARSPSTFRRSRLVLYQDLIREINRPGIGLIMTASGTTVSNHNRMIYPVPRNMLRKASHVGSLVDSIRLKSKLEGLVT
jgi:hypothetical protein